ncbi:MAG TPA: NYN domain-containing protein [Candidatus Paceibacterota bacterium]|jgi:uncharacterized LabA/DUF88 family protein|nr:NYN domain-containing protein [Candidatus Paceibacterota bacterium]
MPRVSVYIDNSNVFKNIQAIRRNGDKGWVQLYDPLKLAESLCGNRELSEVYFYCVPPPIWLLAEGEEGKKKHATALRYYEAVAKLPKVQIKYGYLQGGRTDPHEKNVDTQLGTDMVAHAALGKYDIAILVSNDGDFMSALQNTKQLGKRVELLFFKGYVAGSLRRESDLLRRARRSYFQNIYKPQPQQTSLI